MDRNELFQQAKKKREDGKGKTQQNSQWQQFDYSDREPIYNTSIAAPDELKGFKQVRLLGNPIDARNDDPFSAKVIYSSMILGDNGKKFRCIWPEKTEQPNWILWKVFNKITRFTYNRERRERVYHYQDSHPELFNRVNFNSKPENTFERGWSPKASILMNVIDRDMYDWHKENKSTVLLSRKSSLMDSGDIFYEPGYPPTIYNNIWDTICDWAGDFNQYDVVIEKIEKDPWYRVYHPIEHKRQLTGLGFIPYEDTAERELTEEELSWNQINIDNIFRETSYIKIENRLGVFIQEVDKELGTNFYPELKEKAEEQRKEFEKIQRDAEKTAVSMKDNQVLQDDNNKSTSNETVEESNPIRERRKPKETSNSTFNLDSYKDIYLGIEKLTDKERSIIEGYDTEKDKFIFKEGTYEALYLCPNSTPIEEELQEGDCNQDSPEWFHVCPKCGEEFNDDLN